MNRIARNSTRAAVAAALAAGALAAPALAGTAAAEGQYCGGNDYASEVTVTDFGSGQFKISVSPTSNARYAAPNGYRVEATHALWQAVQACVPGLYGGLADGIYQQIDCHIWGTYSGPFHAGGETYDLESWRAPVGADVAAATLCNWGGDPYAAVSGPYRPDRLANNPTF